MSRLGKVGHRETFSLPAPPETIPGGGITQRFTPRAAVALQLCGCSALTCPTLLVRAAPGPLRARCSPSCDLNPGVELGVQSLDFGP
jgi:hypothetical protein